MFNNAVKHFFFWSLVLTTLCIADIAKAQVEGITLRAPPMTHAFIDSGDMLLGVGLSYLKVKDPGFTIANVTPETVITSEQFVFLAIGLWDRLAIGVSSNPTEIEISGTQNNTSSQVDTKLKSSRTYYYLIPTLYRWQRSRVALIWGKGRATIQENTTLGIEAEEYEIGTTGLFGEFFLGEAFSVVPWMSWPYLLFDIDPPSVADIQPPDYGIDGIFHIGEAKLSLSLIFQALDTVDKSTSDDENRKTSNEKESEQESYAVSLSFRF